MMKKIFLILIVLVTIPSITNAQLTNPAYVYKNQIGNLDPGDAASDCVSQLGEDIAKNFIGSLLNQGMNYLNDYIGSFIGGMSGGLSSITGGGIGGGTVPVNDDTVRETTKKIQGYNAADFAKEFGEKGISLDSIAYCMVNKTIGGITAGTSKWVRTGFNGNPAFIDNPGKYFSDIADYELARILDELSGGILCTPMTAKIRINIINDYIGRTQRKIPKCNLKYIERNIENFISGKSWSWDTWNSYTQNPQNNYYGAQLLVNDELYDRISSSQSSAKTELDWNNGYQSIRDEETGEITTPGNLIQFQVQERLNIPVQRLTFADEYDEMMDDLLGEMVEIDFSQAGGWGQ